MRFTFYAGPSVTTGDRFIGVKVSIEEGDLPGTQYGAVVKKGLADLRVTVEDGIDVRRYDVPVGE